MPYITNKYKQSIMAIGKKAPNDTFSIIYYPIKITKTDKQTNMPVTNSCEFPQI